MKKIFFYIIVCIPLFLSTTFAQKVRKPIQVESSKKQSSGFEYGLGLTNRYIWRGLDLAESPALVPNLIVTLGGLSLHATGVYALADKIDWNNEKTDVEELVWFADKVHATLKNLNVNFSIETI